MVAGPQGADGSGLFSFTTSTAKPGSLHPDKSDAQDLSHSLENREPTKPRMTSSAKVVWQGSLRSTLCGLPDPSAVRCGPSHTLPPRAAVYDVLQHQTWSHGHMWLCSDTGKWQQLQACCLRCVLASAPSSLAISIHFLFFPKFMYI